MEFIICANPAYIAAAPLLGIDDSRRYAPYWTDCTDRL